MSSSLDTIRYHSGIAGEEVADMVDSLEQEITTLREQVEKLTEAYDQCGRTVQDYGRTIDQTESRLREVATHCANVEQQLAALAEQNEKMRSFLEFAWKDVPMNEYAFKILEHVMNLPNLATPVLNKIKAEAYREAALYCESRNSNREYPYACYDQGYDDAASDCSEAIRAKADELEQSK